MFISVISSLREQPQDFDDRGTEFIPAREWMGICFEFLMESTQEGNPKSKYEHF